MEEKTKRTEITAVNNSEQPHKPQHDNKRDQPEIIQLTFGDVLLAAVITIVFSGSIALITLVTLAILNHLS